LVLNGLSHAFYFFSPAKVKKSHILLKFGLNEVNVDVRCGLTVSSSLGISSNYGRKSFDCECLEGQICNDSDDFIFAGDLSASAKAGFELSGTATIYPFAPIEVTLCSLDIVTITVPASVNAGVITGDFPECQREVCAGGRLGPLTVSTQVKAWNICVGFDYTWDYTMFTIGENPCL
jgi:hypothetical protein